MSAQMRAALATILFVSFSGASDLQAYAQSPGAGSFVTDTKSGCRVWNPHPEPNESARWSGGCVNGLAQGRGSLEWLNNNKPYEKDEGDWNKGQQSGSGTQVWSLGRYVGDFQNGEPHGQGVMTLQSARYEGQFRNGKPNGIGTVTNLDGIFKGSWKDGCLVGDKRKITFSVSSSSCR